MAFTSLALFACLADLNLFSSLHLFDKVCKVLFTYSMDFVYVLHVWNITMASAMLMDFVNTTNV